MNRLSVLIALAMVFAGAVLVVDGPAGVRHVWQLTLRYGGLLLIALAVVALIAAVVPRGALIGPVIVAAIGAAVLTMQMASWSQGTVWAVGGAGAVVAGGWIVMASTAQPEHSDDPVWRRRAVLFPRRLELPPTVEWPEHLSVLTMGATVTVDLQTGRPPAPRVMELAISCWAGRVEIHVPKGWAVVAGRLHAATAIELSGQLDRQDPVPDPYEKQARDRLARMVVKRGAGSAVVVLHVVGVVGAVIIRRGT